MNAVDVELPGPFNILVASNLSATAKDLPSALANLYDSVLEDGFLYLQEMTGALRPQLFVSSLMPHGNPPITAS